MASNFDQMHKNLQPALVDLIFNLGTTKIVSSSPDFYWAPKASDWKKTANESNGPDVRPT